MLTDVFINRYEDRLLWHAFGERERRFMAQATNLVTKQIFPYWINGEVNKSAETTLQSIHDRLAHEIGIDPLSPLYLNSYRYTIAQVISNFLQRPFAEANGDADSFVKRRLSLVELAFRDHEAAVESDNLDLPRRLNQLTMEEGLPKLARALQLPGFDETTIRALNQERNLALQSNIAELNERLRQARFPLVYRNGFLQIEEDPIIAVNIEAPFWALVADAKWKVVETDMLEAIDRRDNRRQEASFPAAKALESTIKIISDHRGWTKGHERGAAHYIDNLVSENNGRFIDTWESDFLKGFFREVRNKMGHGPGNAPHLELNEHQERWAIETCMSWIKSLIARL